MARRARTEPETAGSFAPEAKTMPGAKVFAEIAAGTKSVRPAREVLRRVRAVPTIFPAVDMVTRVGGWPTDRLAFVHGPSMAGKTQFVNGLGLSWLQKDHPYVFIDAECTTPIPWLEMQYGSYAHSGLFFASRPVTYEQATDDVKRIAEGFAEAREKGRFAKDTTCLFVVDSLGKLVPKRLQEQIDRAAAESKDGSIDGMKGAAGMYRAALNKYWCDQLIPLMASTGCAFVGVLREGKDRNASDNDRRWGNDWTVQGGGAAIYEASLDVRVSEAIVLHEIERGKDGWRDSPVVGEKHVVEIHKTKVSARKDEVEKTFFHTSSGHWTPEGFDRTRDLLELGVELGVIDKRGSWLSFGGKRFNGDRKFMTTRHETEYLAGLELAVRSRFADDLAKTKPEVVGG